jgi:hypothetical protein
MPSLPPVYRIPSGFGLPARCVVESNARDATGSLCFGWEKARGLGLLAIGSSGTSKGIIDPGRVTPSGGSCSPGMDPGGGGGIT